MKIPLPKFLKGGLAFLIVFTIILAVLPVVGIPKEWILYFFLFFVYLALANMWNLLAGYCGLISLAQPAFIGIAGYVLAITCWVGYPMWLGVIGGGIVAGAFALLISMPAFRLKGIYFAIGTLIVPSAVTIIFFLWRPVGDSLYGKGAGYIIKGATNIDQNAVFWISLAVGIGSIFLMRFILGSKFGLGLAAIRDSENTAAHSGVDVFRLKLYSFLISAFVTGLAGAIFYISQGFIEPSSAFNINWTMVLMLSTVIGGIAILEGPILGTVVVVILHFLLARMPGYSLLIQGVILILIMLLAPQGLVGMFRRSRIYSSFLKLDTGPEVKAVAENEGAKAVANGGK
jgi:branched-chain amino acid transport system permease protein